MHITQPPTPKFKVTVLAQTLSVCNFVFGLYYSIRIYLIYKDIGNDGKHDDRCVPMDSESIVAVENPYDLKPVTVSYVPVNSFLPDDNVPEANQDLCNGI